METKKYTHNNSTDYYSQINNRRDPYVACFNTSMINVGLNLIGLVPPKALEKTGNYDQPEDQFDWYMHNSLEVKDWVDNYCKTPWVDNYLKAGGDIRELWEVEVYCFNKWISKNVCKAVYNLSKHDFIEEIQRGRGIVTTGKFCKFAHAVSVVGFVADLPMQDKDLNLTGDNISIQISDSCDEITDIIIDDSYGNPNNEYKPVGKDGNDVRVAKDKFFTAINKATNENKEVFYGILFQNV